MSEKNTQKEEKREIIILLPAEKTILSPFVKSLKIILANYEELSFSDFQLILSNTSLPLGYARTAMILSILERYGAVYLIGKERPRRYAIVKSKLDAIIQAVMQ
jgi:hypothetical protein